MDSNQLPLLSGKFYSEPSVFTAENMLREARRQKGLREGKVPPICILDPDGDLVDYLQNIHQAQRLKTWACYHTNLDTFVNKEIEYGIVGRVVGASFAVLVAEELFTSGCQLLISITSAGQIIPISPPPYIILIDKALRDEGTSYHYLPPAPYSYLNSDLKKAIISGWDITSLPLEIGACWTTDAPFRETEEAISLAREKGILAVEMEAAALYALATAKNKNIVCFANVTNLMAQSEGDFEKGLAQGSIAALELIYQTARVWRNFEK